MPRKAATVCSTPGCPTLTTNHRCDQCTTAARQTSDAQRGTAAQRGYDAAWERTRKAYLQAFPICCLCGHPSRVADHHPTSRRDLIAAGVIDPDAWHHLRPLCWPCHSQQTARLQPGGWNQ